MSEISPDLNVIEGLEVVGPITWDEVKAIWKQGEDTDSFRREYAEEGYESWEAWRGVIIQPLHLDRLDWTLYDIKEPLETIPTFRGGPFKPWEDRYYGGITTPTFAEIVATEETDVSTRDKFAEIIESSEATKLIGLLMEGEVYIIEGMHRATSIALAASRDQKFQAHVQLLLAQSDLPQLDTIG